MTSTKFERLLERMRVMLREHPALTNDFSGQIVLNVNQGGLSTVTLTQTLVPNKQQEAVST
jgi:hypothetical protein